MFCALLRGFAWRAAETPRAYEPPAPTREVAVVGYEWKDAARER